MNPVLKFMAIVLGLSTPGVVYQICHRDYPHFKEDRPKIKDLKVGESTCSIYVYASREHNFWIRLDQSTEDCSIFKSDLDIQIDRPTTTIWRVTIRGSQKVWSSDKDYGTDRAFVRADEVVWK